MPVPHSSKWRAAGLAAAGLIAAGLVFFVAQAAAPQRHEMSFEELRACAQGEAAIQAEQGRIDAQSAALEARKAKLAGEAAAWVEQGAVFTETDPRRVAHSKVIAAYNADAEALQASTRAVMARAAKQDETCKDRDFRQADFARLPPELQRVVTGEGGIGGEALTYEQVVACARRAVASETESARLDALRAQVEGRARQLDARQRELAAAAAALDVSDKAAVTAHNAQVSDLRAAVAANQQHGRAGMAEVQAWNEASLAFDAECKAYREEDLARLPPDLQAALRRRLFGEAAMAAAPGQKPE